jgi:regulator of protease activity HflC (stomatin/prohibitin superfamily)
VSGIETIVIGSVVAVIAVFILATSLYIVKQWEKVAVIRFGRIIKVVDTGLYLKIPWIDSIQRVDLRMQTVDLRGQSAITKDNISVGIDAVVFMRIEDAAKVILGIRDYYNAVAKYAQTSIRNVIGRYSLDDLLESREEIAASLKVVIDELAKDWGIDITRAELQDISLPTDMKRAFAVQAEAQRESRAVLIKAQAELGASKMLRPKQYDHPGITPGNIKNGRNPRCRESRCDSTQIRTELTFETCKHVSDSAPDPNLFFSFTSF